MIPAPITTTSYLLEGNFDFSSESDFSQIEKYHTTRGE